MARLSCVISEKLDALSERASECVKLDYVRLHAERAGYYCAIYEAYGEDNKVACKVCDISYPDGSLLHLEFDVESGALTLNSPY